MKIAKPLALHAICLMTSLPLLSTTSEAKETRPVKVDNSQIVAAPQRIWFADGYLTVRVQDLPLGELLDRIAGKSGLTIVRPVALERKVSLEFDRLSLEQALRRILRHRSFVLEYAAAQPRTLWILPQRDDKPVVEPRIVASGNAQFHKEDIVTRMARALSSGDPEAREQAAVELGETGHANAVGPLTAALADKDKDVREAAIVSLAEIGSAEAVQALAIALRDKDPRVREEAVDALGEIGGEIAIGLLEQTLSDKVGFVRQAAIEVLDELRGR